MVGSRDHAEKLEPQEVDQMSAETYGKYIIASCRLGLFKSVVASSV